MLEQPTVLLHHATQAGSHYDWLMGDPGPGSVGDVGAKLWTARIALPSEQWAAAGWFELLMLPPHRRAYLTYQGPISDGRGWVRRVDEGVALPRLWRQSQAVLTVTMRHFQGDISLRRLAEARWEARASPA